jgi:hypothetical protein
MNIESARSLKESLMTQVVPSLVEMLPRVRAYGLPAAPLAAVEENPRAIALGLIRQKKDYKLAVRVQHRALLDSPKVEQIKKRAKGEVDIKYIGRVHVRSNGLRNRHRPLVIGCSVGHYKITAGTIGAFVSPKGGDAPAILSNNHVLANENRARKGDAILQPGDYDGGKNPADEVAGLTKFIRLRRSGANHADAAYASLNDAIKFDPVTIAGTGKLKGVSSSPVADDLEVRKSGRTTGATRGRVTAFELDGVVVDYDIGTIRFDNQIEIEADDKPFSLGGDSGSLIVDANGEAVALLFAGSDSGGAHGHGTTYANPIQAVLDGLGVTLLLS